MSAMSNYLENELVKHIFRTGSFTKPSVLAIALCTSAPTDADTGALSGKEVSGGSYARQTLNPSDSNWAATSGTDGLTSNASQITFPEATANWGTVTHFAIVDSATAGSGNLLFHGALTASKAVDTGDQLVVKVNQLTVTFA